jgi:hypothetical protein
MAAEIKEFSSLSASAVLDELTPAFQKRSATSSNSSEPCVLFKPIQAGETADVLVLRTQILRSADSRSFVHTPRCCSSTEGLFRKCSELPS